MTDEAEKRDAEAETTEPANAGVDGAIGTGETPGQGTPAGETPATVGSETERSGEPFDPERAMATIRKLRAYERQAKTLQSQLNALRSSLSARSAEGEAETPDVGELQGEIEAIVEERNTLELKTNVIAAAADVGFLHPADAWALVDTAKLQMKEDGSVEGLAEELQRLVDEKRLPMRGAGGAAGAGVVNPAGDAASRLEQYRREYFGNTVEENPLWQGGGYVHYSPGGVITREAEE